MLTFFFCQLINQVNWGWITLSFISVQQHEGVGRAVPLLQQNASCVVHRDFSSSNPRIHFQVPVIWCELCRERQLPALKMYQRHHQLSPSSSDNDKVVPLSRVCVISHYWYYLKCCMFFHNVCVFPCVWMSDNQMTKLSTNSLKIFNVLLFSGLYLYRCFTLDITLLSLYTHFLLNDDSSFIWKKSQLFFPFQALRGKKSSQMRKGREKFDVFITAPTQRFDATFVCVCVRL